jgi:hypothetical protein
MPSQLLQIRGIFPATLGPFAIWSAHLPQIAPAWGGPTGSTLCRLFNQPGGPQADRSCRPCEGGRPFGVPNSPTPHLYPDT